MHLWSKVSLFSISLGLLSSLPHSFAQNNDTVVVDSVRLFGWEKCSASQQKQINQAWQDAMDIAYYVYYNIDFNAYPEIQFFGPPSLNKNDQSNIKSEYISWQAVNKSGYVSDLIPKKIFWKRRGNRAIERLGGSIPKQIGLEPVNAQLAYYIGVTSCHFLRQLLRPEHQALGYWLTSSSRGPSEIFNLHASILLEPFQLVYPCSLR